MSSEQNFTLTSATKACGVSMSTMQRKLDTLRKYGAIKIGRQWKIPASALIAAGLPLDRVTSPEQVTKPVNEQYETSQEKDQLYAQIADWKALYERERQRADKAEARLEKAEERLDRLLPSAEPIKQGFWNRLFKKGVSTDEKEHEL
ncbi:hypothetical protein [Mobiluncus mulieris]|uniref:hypothetical protein n=1 Tax=Mobiluncus mulieris TaxID=2052 RepID=UPI0014703482|nr:hypothetical protein [Mobiluncus mulieris]NMX12589.1 hypothetical protein [Mobiluncus mulieris]